MSHFGYFQVWKVMDGVQVWKMVYGVREWRQNDVWCKRVKTECQIKWGLKINFRNVQLYLKKKENEKDGWTERAWEIDRMRKIKKKERGKYRDKFYPTLPGSAMIPSVSTEIWEVHFLTLHLRQRTVVVVTQSWQRCGTEFGVCFNTVCCTLDKRFVHTVYFFCCLCNLKNITHFWRDILTVRCAKVKQKILKVEHWNICFPLRYNTCVSDMTLVPCILADI